MVEIFQVLMDAKPAQSVECLLPYCYSKIHRNRCRAPKIFGLQKPRSWQSKSCFVLTQLNTLPLLYFEVFV